MMIESAWTALAPPEPAEMRAMATIASVQHHQTFYQAGTYLAERPEAEMMSSVMEPESDEVRK